MGSGQKGSCIGRKACHSWSYKGARRSHSVWLGPLGDGLSEKEVLGFLPFFFSKLARKQPLWGLKTSRALREAATPAAVDRRQCPESGPGEAQERGLQANSHRSSQTRHRRSCQPSAYGNGGGIWGLPRLRHSPLQFRVQGARPPPTPTSQPFAF